MYAFGRDISYSFYPLVDEANTSGVVTSQTPAIYIFADLPSRDAASDGTGSIATITSWTWDATNKCFTYTIPAIDDPDPTSLTDTETYFQGINFLLQATEQIQTVVKGLVLERVRGQGSRVTLAESDLAVKWKHVNSYTTGTSQRTTLIAEAVVQVRNHLAAKGYKWSQILDVSKLNDAVAWKTLANIALSEIQTGNTKFNVLYAEFKANYENALAEVLLEYDVDNDGAADTPVQAGSGTVLLLR